MGDNWLDKYAAAPQDATSVAPVSPPAAPPQPTIGANTRPDWAMHAVPQPFGDHVQQALNAIGLGNPLPHLYDAYTQMKHGHPIGSLLSAAAAIPLLPEGDAARVGGLLHGFIPAGESVAREGALEAQRLAAAHMANTAEALPLRTLVKPPTPPAGAASMPGMMNGLDESLFTRKAPYVPPAPVPKPMKKQPFVGPL